MKSKAYQAIIAGGLMIHMFCVGLPVALAVRRFSKYE